MKDLKAGIKFLEAAAPAVAKASIEGGDIDLKGFRSCVFEAVIGAGAYEATKCVAPVLEESDDGTTYAAVDEADYDGDLSAVADTIAANEYRSIQYHGYKRYVRLSFEVTGTLAADVLLGAWAILGHPHLAPTA
jgi:hypothetical protein